MIFMFRRYELALRVCFFLAIFAVPVCTAAPVTGYRIIARFPHSTDSYTEGFFYLDGLFYEGIGLEGQSGVLVTEPTTGKVVRRVMLPPQYFGEGIVDWGPYLYEWTWKSHTGFIYDRATLRLVKQFFYSGEGWGMTHTKDQIVTSDGSPTLTFREPKTFDPVRTVRVHDGANPVDQVNELEFIKGEIYANVWHSDKIARISATDGHVIAWIDLSGILPASEKVNQESVLNGIAYDAKRDRLFVTGKQWPTIFQIEVVPRQTRTISQH